MILLRCSTCRLKRFQKQGSSLSHEQDWCHLPFAAWSCSRNSPSCNVELSGRSSRNHLTSYLLRIFSYNHWIWANSMTLHQPERKLGFAVSLIHRSSTSTSKWVRWRILSVGDMSTRFSPIPKIWWLSNSLLNTDTNTPWVSTNPTNFWPRIQTSSPKIKNECIKNSKNP